MAKEKKNTEQKETLTKEALEAMIHAQEKIDADEAKRVEQLLAVKFKTKQLGNTNTSIKRGERKDFQKTHQLDLRNYEMFDMEEQELLIDFLIEKRGIEDADSIEEGELHLWVKQIMGRTLTPLAFEGN